MLSQVNFNDRRAIGEFLLHGWYRGMRATFSLVTRCRSDIDVLLVEESHFMRIALERIVLDEDFHCSPFRIDLVETVIDTHVTVRRVDSSYFAFEKV